MASFSAMGASEGMLGWLKSKVKPMVRETRLLMPREKEECCCNRTVNTADGANETSNICCCLAAHTLSSASKYCQSRACCALASLEHRIWPPQGPVMHCNGVVQSSIMSCMKQRSTGQ